MRFRYRLRQVNGVVVKGTLEAQNEHDARLRLLSRDGILLMLRPTLLYVPLPRRDNSLRGVIKQLALLAGASLPLRESLALVIRQQTRESTRTVLEDIYRQVCQGQALSDAMSRHQRYFEPLCNATIAAGEYSGDLAGALNSYADFKDEQHRLLQALRQAISYPIFLLIVSCTVIGVLLAVAVPQIVSQLSLSGMALPWSTQLVLALGEGVRNALLPGFGVITLGCIVLYICRHNQAWRYRVDRIGLQIPFFGVLLLRLQQVRLLMILSVLCRSAVPMADALHLACNALSNRCFRMRAQQVKNALVEGDSFSVSLSRYALFPADVLALILAGEQGGRLSDTLAYLARIQREAMQQQLLGIVKLVEPVMILVLGLVVLLVFMAIIQPMLSMNSFAF